MSDKTALGGVTEQMITEGEQSQALSPANVRHTLRTPLNHIIGYSEMLLEEADERGLEAFTADLQKIHKAGKQLLGFINEFFDAPAAERPQHMFQKRPPPTVSSVKVKPGIHPLAGTHGTPAGRILVVDDNESNRDMLSRRLQHEGYDVCIAANGHEALALLKTASGRSHTA